MTNHSHISIFLADDDEDDRNLFSEALKKSAIDASLSSFSHCVELLKHLESCIILPDMIFLDINMPLLNGKECLKKIRKELTFLHIPVIMYSTSATATDIEESFNGGASLYVEKPFSFTDQVTMFKRISEQYHSGGFHKTSRTSFMYKP